MARKILEEENQKVVVVKNGQVVFKSIDRGIKPMYYLSKELKEEAKKSSIADRVIGKGAAILCGYLEITELYGELMSENAIQILEKRDIQYSFNEKCSYIKNREKTDYCPIEKRSLDIEEPTELLKRIENFLNSLK